MRKPPISTDGSDPASIIAQALKKKFAHRRRQEANSPGTPYCTLSRFINLVHSRCRVNIQTHKLKGYQELPYAYPLQLLAHLIIDYFCIFGIGLGIACNGGLCREYHYKEIKHHLHLKRLPALASCCKLPPGRYQVPSLESNLSIILNKDVKLITR